MDSGNIVFSKTSRVLDLPPSCLQFSRKHPDYFVVGTYNLQKETDLSESPSDDSAANDASSAVKPQSRNGSLVVFRLAASGDDTVTLVHTLSQPSALLDLRFQDTSGDEQDILAAVSSTGSLAIFRFEPYRDGGSPLQHLATSRCEDAGEDVLFLQCSWHPSLPNLIGVTTSTGKARLLYLNDQWCISNVFDVDIANTLEAWSIAFSPTTAALGQERISASVYCGGDDSMLRYTSCSWPANDGTSYPHALSGPITIKGKHGAGVTAILPLTLKTKQGGRVVVTGSYDDHLRVFVIFDLDVSHGLRRIEEVIDENMGGGVWRLNLVSLDTSGPDCTARIVLLASCMHAGARVVEIRLAAEGSWTCRVLARFEEHQSMNYASDFSPQNMAKLRVVSTSFYDKLLCVWESDVRP